MAFYRNELVITDITPEGFIDGFLEHMFNPKRLRICSRSNSHLTLARKRFGTFVACLVLSAIVPAVSWLLAWWIYSRHTRWALTLSVQPHPRGSLVSFALQAPTEQQELEARIRTGNQAEELRRAMFLIGSG